MIKLYLQLQFVYLLQTTVVEKLTNFSIWFGYSHISWLQVDQAM